MDLYDPQRHLVHSGTVARRHGSEWRDVTLSLLDNFGQCPTHPWPSFRSSAAVPFSVIITSAEVRLGRTYNVLISRVSACSGINYARILNFQ